MTQLNSCSAKIYYQTALDLGLKAEIIDNEGYLKISDNKQSFFFVKSKTPLNNQPAVVVSHNKQLSCQLIAKEKIPIPEYIVINKEENLSQAVKKIGFPLVAKPNIGGGGEFVFTQLKTLRQVLTAFRLAKRKYTNIIIEKYSSAVDFRLLVLDGQVIGALKRQPPQVIGNGQATIQQLIKKENRKRIRKYRQQGTDLKNRIVLSKFSQQLLKNKGWQLTSIPPKNQTVVLKGKANVSTGGSCQTVNKEFFHPSIVKTVVKISQILDLRLTAVDLLIKDPKKPFNQENGLFLETNTAVGLSAFYYPNSGQEQKAALPILKSLFSLKSSL